jgi:pyruvate formate lyase activating enzyme
MAQQAMISDIKRFAVHAGDGIRTTVFFKGCPLRCVWCHNPEGLTFQPQVALYAHKCGQCGECAGACVQQAHLINERGHVFLRDQCCSCGKCVDVCMQDALKLYGKSISVSELLPYLLEDRVFYENSNGGVTLSGGECLMQAEFCAELLQQLKAENIHTAIDTCGFVPRTAFDRVMPFTDVFLYDFKALDAEVHQKCTGQSNELILDNLRYLEQCGKKIEIRIPYVPQYNNDQIEKIADFLQPFRHIERVRVLPYHNYAGSKYDALGYDHTLPALLPTDDEIETAEQIIRQKVHFNAEAL